MQLTAFIGLTVLAATTSATSVFFVCPADAIGECCLVIDALAADDIQLCTEATLERPPVGAASPRLWACLNDTDRYPVCNVVTSTLETICEPATPVPVSTAK